MSLPEEVSALETVDQIVEWIFGLSDTELIDGLIRYELAVGGSRSENCRRLKRLLLLYRGFSDKSSVSDLAFNATQGSRDDLRGLEAHKDVDDHTEIPASVRAPVTVTASEFMRSFPITTMAGTMSRGAGGYVTVSELVHGVTTSRITPSALTTPSDLALAYGYATLGVAGKNGKIEPSARFDHEKFRSRL